MAEKKKREEERLMNKYEDWRKRKKMEIETGERGNVGKVEKKSFKVKRVEQVV
jgi:hypothetical protein